MDFRLLRYYIATIEEGSIQAAARRLNIAQPALSRRIRDLELALDCSLLDRGTRGVTPTRAGTAFYQESLALLRQLDRAIFEARRLGVEQGSEVRLGVVQTARKYDFVQKAIAAWTATSKEPGIAFLRGYSAELAEALREDRLDITLLYEYRTGSQRLCERLVHRERYVLAVHPAHPLAEEGPVELARLSGHGFTWLARQSENGEQDILLQQCRRHGLDPVIDRFTETHEEQIDLTVVSSGICLTPASTILASSPGQFVFRPIPAFRMELDLSLGWHAELENPFAQGLLDALHAAIDEHQAAVATGIGGLVLYGHPTLFV